MIFYVQFQQRPRSTNWLPCPWKVFTMIILCLLNNKKKKGFFQPTILTLPIILHSEEMIWKARRLRKALGGGMRQTGFVLCIFYVFVRCIIEYCKLIGFSGVVAAAGLFGLEHVYPRLGEDHARGKKMIMAISTRRMGMVMMII